MTIALTYVLLSLVEEVVNGCLSTDFLQRHGKLQDAVIDNVPEPADN